jgi:abequosyltransferase
LDTLSKPLLSICIPTYNSANYLRNALNSIVNQDGFDHRCEIVISDNNSNDDTSQMVHDEFVCRYENIRYYSNKININDENFIKSLNYGKGKYIKLHSDKWCFIDNKLSDLLNHLEQSDNDVIFLLNQNSNSIDAGAIQCFDFNKFVSIVSYWSTWITGVIYKNSSYKNLKEKERYVSRQLAQTDILFRLLRGSSGLVINDKMMIGQALEFKGGYNLFKVFIGNYLTLYQDYLQEGTLSRQTYNKEKINLLIKFIFPWYTKMFLIKDKRYKFETARAHYEIFKYYYLEPRLYLYPMYLINKVIRKSIKQTLKRMRN